MRIALFAPRLGPVRPGVIFSVPRIRGWPAPAWWPTRLTTNGGYLAWMAVGALYVIWVVRTVVSG